LRSVGNQYIFKIKNKRFSLPMLSPFLKFPAPDFLAWHHPTKHNIIYCITKKSVKNTKIIFAMILMLCQALFMMYAMLAGIKRQACYARSQLIDHIRSGFACLP
jgi:hypothetical protein